MNISAKTEYACIAVLELSLRYASGNPVRIRDIAEAHGIPSRFLVQILLQLKGAGMVTSIRGASGGYRMAKKPEEITLGEVMSVIEGQPDELRLSAGNQTAHSQALLEIWQQVAGVQRKMLYSVSFADLVEKIAASDENMYYI